MDIIKELDDLKAMGMVEFPVISEGLSRLDILKIEKQRNQHEIKKAEKELQIIRALKNLPDDRYSLSVALKAHEDLNLFNSQQSPDIEKLMAEIKVKLQENS